MHRSTTFLERLWFCHLARTGLPRQRYWQGQRVGKIWKYALLKHIQHSLSQLIQVCLVASVTKLANKLSNANVSLWTEKKKTVHENYISENTSYICEEIAKLLTNLQILETFLWALLQAKNIIVNYINCIFKYQKIYVNFFQFINVYFN